MTNALLDALDLDTESLEDEEIDAILSEIGPGNEEAAERAAQRMIASGAEYDNRGGFVTVYDTVTGMPSQVLYYMLQKTLKMRRTEEPGKGKRVFSLKPLVQYRMGDLPCMLHESHPMRPLLNSLGLEGRVCPKRTLRTLLDVRRHMLRRHHDEWDVIQENEAKVREDEEREFRQFQTAFMMQQMAGNGAVKPESAARPAKPFSQLNRAELTQMAREAGLLASDTEYEDGVTNAQIRDAIKAHREA